MTEETTSTQTDAVSNFHPGSVFISEFQSSGRGRLDRKFIVPPRKGLTFSICLDIRKDFSWIPLVTGLAVADAIDDYLESQIVELKWPNDLLINSKKVCGILSEKVDAGVVVGIGLNIFQKKEELPIVEAISLSMIKDIDREALFVSILNQIGLYLSNLDDYKNRYREKCSTISKKIRVTLPNGEVIEEIAIGISNEGSLLLRTREINVADVVHLG